MGTRAFITVKVRKEDMGKAMKFRNDLLPAGRTMARQDLLAVPTVLTKPYATIYTHHDGGLADTGAALATEFNTYERALNLVLAGDIDSASYEPLEPNLACRDEQSDVLLTDELLERDDVRYCHYYLFDDDGWKLISYDAYGRLKQKPLTAKAGFKAHDVSEYVTLPLNRKKDRHELTMCIPLFGRNFYDVADDAKKVRQSAEGQAFGRQLVSKFRVGYPCAGFVGTPEWEEFDCNREIGGEADDLITHLYHWVGNLIKQGKNYAGHAPEDYCLEAIVTEDGICTAYFGS